MKTAIMYIAERCNQDCVFCLEVDGSWTPFVDPTTRQVVDQINRLRSRGADQITFMGGETFFRKDLPQIITHAKSIQYKRVGVVTNGTVLSASTEISPP
jgi:molybdenum cofactor biosynthesis enzyme MoaA